MYCVELKVQMNAEDFTMCEFFGMLSYPGWAL